MDAIRACRGFFNVIAASVSDFCLQSVDCLDSLISSDDSAIMYLILLLINSIVGHPYEDPLLSGIREQVMEAVLDEEFWDECYKASRTVTDKKTSEMSSTTVDMTVVSASRQCCICLEEFQEGKLIPQCHHVFHPGCIDIWLKSHSSCPLCRGHVS